MSGRPATGPAQWASDDVYDSAGKNWNTKPTKLQPSAGRIAEGFEPGERIPAEFFNWLANNFGVHLQYLDGLQAQTWSVAKEINTNVWALDGTEHYPLIWDPWTRGYWMNGPQSGGAVGGHLYTSPNGVDWTDSGFTSSDEPVGLAVAYDTLSKGTGGMIMPLVSNRIHKRGVADDPSTWANVNEATATSFQGCEWDPNSGANGLWWIFGKGSDGHPGIWTATESLAAITKRTINSPGSGAGKILYFAQNEDGSKYVMAGDWNDGAGNIPQIWYTTAFSVAWTKVGSVASLFGAGTVITALRYDRASKLFVATEIHGAVWVSVDGATWIQQAASDADRVWLNNCLECNGSLWVGLAYDSSGVADLSPQWRILYSTNLGVTWTDVPWPMGVLDLGKALTYTNGQFVAISNAGAGQNYSVKISFSQRVNG